MRTFSSTLGEQLYNLLPAFYREQDNTVYDKQNQIEQLGDLALYLDSCGILLDQIHNTLEQRLADSFPDNPRTGRACQDWLIPYFARLLDVQLVSPHVAGQRDEVANAISWRQRKGTRSCIEEIGEAITQQELEIQEGWQRVAVTPRIGMPLLPLAVYGIDKNIDVRQAMQVFRHPGLPAATIDFRCISRAVQVSASNPASKTSHFAGVPYRWMQANPHGVPATPGSYDDVSRRTVDFRTADWRNGHIHPRRIIANKPVPMGLFSHAAVTLDWNEIRDSAFVVFSYDDQEKHVYIRNRSHRPVIIDSDVLLYFADVDAEIFTIEGIRFGRSLTLNNGMLRLRKTSASHVVVNTAYALLDTPALDARDSLFGDLSIPAGSVRMDSCTVIEDAVCLAITASNCIFNGAIRDDNGEAPANGRIRYSRIPEDLSGNIIAAGSLLLVEEENCTSETADFFNSNYHQNHTSPLTADSGVLTPASPRAICFGADDGGELGVYHHGRFDTVVHIQQAQSISLQEKHDYTLQDLVFEDSLTIEADSRFPLRLKSVAARELAVATAALSNDEGVPLPLLLAADCIFETVNVNEGLAQLEYCTITGQLQYSHLQASDCIFSDNISSSSTDGMPTPQDCIRYCRIPATFFNLVHLRFPSCTSEKAIFYHTDFMRALAGEAGFGVLHPATAASVAFGAEDGGEMGAYHAKRYTLQDDALLDKLRNYLPVGIQAVLKPDKKLNQPPYAGS